MSIEDVPSNEEAARHLQRLLMSAKRLVALETIMAWTAEQKMQALRWAEGLAQVEPEQVAHHPAPSFPKPPMHGMPAPTQEVEDVRGGFPAGPVNDVVAGPQAPRPPPRPPDYVLWAVQAGGSAPGSNVGAAWEQPDGSFRLKLDAFVTLQSSPDLVLRLYPNTPRAERR